MGTTRARARSICICGSRMFWPTQHSEWMRDEVIDLVQQLHSHGDVLVNGVCPSGVDEWALSEAERIGCRVRKFPADWDAFGNSAGPRRNAQMRGVADEVHAFWDGASPGTHDMVTNTPPASLYIYMVGVLGVQMFEPPNALSESTKWLMEESRRREEAKP